MTVLHEGFVGYQFNNCYTEFSGSDKEELFLNNLKTQPDDWYYRTNKVSYTYNRYGHRCKNIEDTDLDNYILFTGCSHTEGVGLALENTYPYLLANHLNCDYYNLAVGGSGMDVIMYNLTMWYKTVKKLPKMLFIQNPEHTRFAIYDSSMEEFKFKISANANDDEGRFMVYGEQIGFFDTRFFMNNMLINQLYSDSTIIRIDWENLITDENNCMLTRIDNARDLSHAGIESNQLLVNNLLNQFN